jgi:hypothetical protein
MFKRIILILVLSLSSVGLDDAKAQTAETYRSYASTYLKTAVTHSLEAYQKAQSSGSNDAYVAYFYSLYAKYYSEVSAWLGLIGNTTIAAIFDQYAYTVSTYGLQRAWQTYRDSTSANSTSAYYSYLYTYLGNLYSYYASIYR